MIADHEIAGYLDDLRDQLRGSEDRFGPALKELFDTLARNVDAARAAHQRFNLEYAADFKTFAFFQPDENALSRIIADFLNPTGSHGQGTLFLDRLLGRIGHPRLTAESGTAKVRYQDPASYSPDGGILDVTVDLGAFGIGIENKPFAGEQPNQLLRYAQHLRARYSGRFCLIYLSEFSSPPQSLPEAERRDLENAGCFLTMSYSGDLKSWLRECMDESRAAKLRWFIDEFIAYISDQFTNIEGHTQ